MYVGVCCAGGGAAGPERKAGIPWAAEESHRFRNELQISTRSTLAMVEVAIATGCNCKTASHSFTAVLLQ